MSDVFGTGRWKEYIFAAKFSPSRGANEKALKIPVLPVKRITGTLGPYFGANKAYAPTDIITLVNFLFFLALQPRSPQCTRSAGNCERFEDDCFRAAAASMPFVVFTALTSGQPYGQVCVNSDDISYLQENVNMIPSSNPFAWNGGKPFTSIYLKSRRDGEDPLFVSASFSEVAGKLSAT